MTEVKPLISVIVTVYNQERFIGRCLRSLLHQTFNLDKYEIIVVDDGSTDKTPYALKLFCDPKNSVVRIITNKSNLGLPASLNLAINSSKSEYLVRVDSDDFVNENFLNLLHLYLETNPLSDAIACDYLLLNDEEKVIKHANCMNEPIACGIMFRKKQLVEIGLYDEDFRLYEERELRIRFEEKYRIRRLEIPLYRYRRHESNITNDPKAMELHKEKLNKKHNLNT